MLILLIVLLVALLIVVAIANTKKKKGELSAASYSRLVSASALFVTAFALLVLFLRLRA